MVTGIESFVVRIDMDDEVVRDIQPITGDEDKGFFRSDDEADDGKKKIVLDKVDAVGGGAEADVVDDGPEIGNQIPVEDFGEVVERSAFFQLVKDFPNKKVLGQIGANFGRCTFGTAITDDAVEKAIAVLFTVKDADSVLAVFRNNSVIATKTDGFIEDK